MKRHTWKILVAVLGTMSCLALAGCSDNHGDTASPSGGDDLRAYIEEGLTTVQSDFQRDILERARAGGAISEADWKEANNKFAACMAETGSPIELVYDGSNVQYLTVLESGATDTRSAERREVISSCGLKTNGFVNEVYAMQHGAAANGDEAQRAVLSCLIERELVPANTQYEEFVNDLENNRSREFGPSVGEPFAQCWQENT